MEYEVGIWEMIVCITRGDCKHYLYCGSDSCWNSSPFALVNALLALRLMSIIIAYHSILKCLINMASSCHIVFRYLITIGRSCICWAFIWLCVYIFCYLLKWRYDGIHMIINYKNKYNQLGWNIAYRYIDDHIGTCKHSMSIHRWSHWYIVIDDDFVTTKICNCIHLVLINVCNAYIYEVDVTFI